MKLSVTLALLLLASGSLQANAQSKYQNGLVIDDVDENISLNMDENLAFEVSDSLAETDSISTVEKQKDPIKEFWSTQAVIAHADTEKMHRAASKRIAYQQVLQDFKDFEELEKAGKIPAESLESQKTAKWKSLKPFFPRHSISKLNGASMSKSRVAVKSNLSKKPPINAKALDFEGKVSREGLFANIDDEPPNSELRILYGKIADIDQQEKLNDKRLNNYDYKAVPIRLFLYNYKKKMLENEYQELINEFNQKQLSKHQD